MLVLDLYSVDMRIAKDQNIRSARYLRVTGASLSFRCEVRRGDPLVILPIFQSPPTRMLRERRCKNAKAKFEDKECGRDTEDGAQRSWFWEWRQGV